MADQVRWELEVKQPLGNLTPPSSFSVGEPYLVIYEKGPRWSVIDLDNYLGNKEGTFDPNSKGFSRSARKIRLEKSTILVAELRTTSHDRIEAKVDLNELFGNENGSLKFGSKNFAKSANSVKLDGHLLKANLEGLENNVRETRVKLDNWLGNINGKLVWGQTGLSRSAGNYRLNGTVFVADVFATDGKHKPASIDLGKVIKQSQDSSVWEAKLPVILAVSEGKATTSFLSEFEKLLKDEATTVEVYSAKKDNGATLFMAKVKIGTEEDEEIKIFKVTSTDVEAAIYSIGDKTGKKIERQSLELLQAEAHAEVGTIDVGGHTIPSFAGFSANLNVLKGSMGPLDVNVGVGVDSGLGVKNGSVDVEILGCGVTLGKTIGVKLFGSGASLDVGAMFGRMFS